MKTVWLVLVEHVISVAGSRLRTNLPSLTGRHLYLDRQQGRHGPKGLDWRPDLRERGKLHAGPGAHRQHHVSAICRLRAAVNPLSPRSSEPGSPPATNSRTTKSPIQDVASRRCVQMEIGRELIDLEQGLGHMPIFRRRYGPRALDQNTLR